MAFLSVFVVEDWKEAKKEGRLVEREEEGMKEAGQVAEKVVRAERQSLARFEQNWEEFQR